MLATPLKPEAPQPNHEILQLSFRGKCRESKPSKSLLPCWLYKRGAADSAGLSRPICIDLKLPEAWLRLIEAAASRHKRAVEGQKKIYESRLNFVLFTTSTYYYLSYYPSFLTDDGGPPREADSRFLSKAAAVGSPIQ